MRGAKCIVHVYIAQRRHLSRKLVAVFFFTLVEPSVFQQDDLPRRNGDAIDPVAHQRNFESQYFAELARDRRQRKFGSKLAFDRTPKMRCHHDRRASFQRRADRGHRRANARVFGDVARVVLRNVQIGANENATAGQLPVRNQPIKSLDAHEVVKLRRDRRRSRNRSNENAELGIIRTVKPISFSRAEFIAIAIALLILVLQALPDLSALEYRNTNSATEPWRWLTAHFVHVNWQHALINAVALWVVARLFAPDLTPSRQLCALLAAALAISACLALIYPTIEWYRGLSGALHGLFFAGSTLWLIKAKPRALSSAVAAVRAFLRRLDQGCAGATRRRYDTVCGVVGRRGSAASSPRRRSLRHATRTTVCDTRRERARQATARTVVATAKLAMRRRHPMASWLTCRSRSTRPQGWSSHRTSSTC